MLEAHEAQTNGSADDQPGGSDSPRDARARPGGLSVKWTSEDGSTARQMLGCAGCGVVCLLIFAAVGGTAAGLAVWAYRAVAGAG